MYVQWRFGEPGHDPFSRGGDPGGNEERNGGAHGEAQIGPPGTERSGSDQVTYTVSRRDLMGILGSYYREIMCRLRALF